MKQLHLIRHAKSSWKDRSLSDIDRPLNKRGINACRQMAPAILKLGCPFDQAFCSPANRAQSTIRLISDSLPNMDVKWHVDPALYTFSSDSLHTWCRALDESITKLLIIGHNPAFTHFCNDLSDSCLTNIPTCGYIQLTATTDCLWKDISETPFELTTLLRPKDLTPHDDDAPNRNG